MDDYTKEDPRGQILLSWEADEAPRYERGSMWHILMSLAAGALLLYAVITGNFLFALIILMSALVIYLSGLGEPRRIDIMVTDLGMVVGDEFFFFREIERFWFIYEPPEVKNLYLVLKNGFRGRMRIPLDDQNPNMLRTAIGQFIHEDLTQDEEPFIEFVGRILKI